MQKSISNRRSARNGVKKSPKNVVHKMFTLLQIRDLRIVFTKKAVSKKRGQCFCPRLCAVLCVVFPVGIAVGVVNRAERIAGGAGGVSVLALRQDVSALVICISVLMADI